MKILALRGENLASLQSRFDIDFSDSCLGTAGLFAITGKTGAGKSTLLDAICLALYGGMPRLQANKKHDAEIGRDDDDHRIKANDVRSILSRGKGEAFAEVDFLADDGTRWCAHWSVRRARAKADGRIQAAEQWLENLNTSQRFAGKKQELQGEIQRLIGLSFEQFRRAVMLPQGEFAAFLKAPANERAELLERMTGGEIYTRLSVLAYERARTEKEKYTHLQAKLGDVVLLSADEKQALTAQTGQLKQQVARLAAQLAELRQHQDVLAATEKLQRRVSTAQAAADASQQALASAAPRHQHIALLEKVQPARSDFLLLQQAQTRLTKLQQTSSAARADLPLKEQLKLDTDTKVAAAEAALAAVKQDWLKLEPDLRAARKLEQQRDSIQHQLAEQKQERKQQQQTADAQKNTLTQLQLQQAELQQTRQALSDKLMQDQSLQAITEQYDAVRDNLEQYLKAQQAQAALNLEKQQVTDAQLTHDKQQAALLARLEQLADTKTGYAAQIAQTDLVALEQQHNQELSQYADKQQFRDLLHQAMAALKEWLSVLAQAEKAQTQQTGLQDSLRDMQQQLAGLLPELEALHIRHAECEHLVQKSREVMQLSDHRAELRADEACPLCGSTEHPYASDNPLADGLLHTQQQRLKTLATTLKQQEARRSHLEQSIPQEQERLSTCRQDLAAFKQQISAIYQRYAVLFDSLQLTEGLNEQAEHDTLQQQLSSWEQEITRSAQVLDALKLANEQRAQQIKQARDAQDALLKLQEQESTLSTEINTLTQQSTQWQERLQSLDKQYGVQDDILQARTAALRLQFAGDSWQQSLQEAGAETFLAQLATSTQQYRRDQQSLANAEQQHTALAPQIAATLEALEHINHQLHKQDAQINVLTEQSVALRQQRETLVAEQDLARLEDKHQQAIETAQKTLVSAQKAQSDAGATLAAMQATLAGQQQQLGDAEISQQQLQQRWTGWQQKLALDETQLSQLLAHDEEWLKQERTDLKALEQAAAAAQVTLQARQQDLREQETLAGAAQQWLAALEISEDDTVDPAEQQAQLASDWQQQKDTLDEQIFHCRQQLSADEQARSKAGSLTRQLAAQQERYELWEKMNELIGSANGSKFRSLAQSLTLQQLVILANEHLQDLAPRYALQPVPGSGLALQVIDHDMGDEVRSVESLSGGESFLVSLALALALASLAADTRQLGSLFIDEGFGTLDPDSLEMALACLDALQADGRQIGVISHVSTLVERIGVQVKVESMGGGQSRVVVG